MSDVLVFDTIAQERRAMRAVNAKLHEMGRVYHHGLPIHIIAGWLEEEGFSPMEAAIYCGAQGRVHEQVGPHTWLALTWYKMESGRYEIVAYLR